MSRAERIAAMCGIGIAALATVIFHLTSPWWLTGLVTGWLLCAGMNLGGGKR